MSVGKAGGGANTAANTTLLARANPRPPDVDLMLNELGFGYRKTLSTFMSLIAKHSLSRTVETIAINKRARPLSLDKINVDYWGKAEKKRIHSRVLMLMSST